MRKRWLILALAFLLLPAVAACGPVQSPTVMVVTQSPTSVAIPSPTGTPRSAARVLPPPASAIPSSTEAPATSAAAATARPPITARTAVIMDRASGKVVYERNAHQRVAPASTTKIMTAIIALEKGQLSDTVTVTAADLRPLGGTDSSVMGLAPGDQLTLENLLWGLLLPSGNDAALVIARQVGGSVDGFVQMMNDKVQEMGLKDTHFVSPHGLDADNHYSSAYDLAMMGRYAMNIPTFAQIVGTDHKVIQASRTFTLDNTNPLLQRKGFYPGVDGIKTGSTDKAGDCLVASVNREGHPLIVVVMGSQAIVPDAARLMSYAYDSFEINASSAPRRFMPPMK